MVKRVPPGYPSDHPDAELLKLKDVTDEVERHLKRGLRAIKIKIGGASEDTDVARVEAVRRQAGPDVKLMVDASTLVVSLSRPDPPRSARERVIALDADVVCLSVAPADTRQPLGTVCGRLNNVARQLALPSGDTLAATFSWPGWR